MVNEISSRTIVQKKMRIYNSEKPFNLELSYLKSTDILFMPTREKKVLLKIFAANKNESILNLALCHEISYKPPPDPVSHIKHL